MSCSYIGNEICLKSTAIRCLNRRIEGRHLDIFLDVGQKKINHACTSEKEIYFIHHRREGLLFLAGTLVTTGQVAETM